MPKVHVVREPFNIDGKDYMRGDEISEPALVAVVREKFPRRVIAQHHDIPAPAPAAPSQGSKSQASA